MAVTNDDRLRLFVERIERLEEEKKGIGDDIKDVYNEAKATGYDAKIMRQIVRLRKMAPDDRKEMEAVLDLYKCALGMDYGPIARAAEPADRAPSPPPADHEPVEGQSADALDELYPEALRLIIESRNASISRVQRHFKIGYNRAAALIDRMARHKIVGPADVHGKREILVADADDAISKAIENLLEPAPGDSVIQFPARELREAAHG